MKTVNLESVLRAYKNLKDVVLETHLTFFEDRTANFFLKREDKQTTGAYKLRGAYNLVSMLSDEKKAKGVVCSSTGNHAQGVAYSCNLLHVNGVIFMPKSTTPEKIAKVKAYCNGNVTIELVGENFDEASALAKLYAKENKKVFVHPFDNASVISGQGTIAVEFMNQLKQKHRFPDYVFVPVGGGGLITGIGAYVKAVSPKTKIVAVESEGSACLFEAMKNRERVVLDKADTFVDAVAVKQVGRIPFEMAKQVIDMYLTISNHLVEYARSTLIEQGIFAEPAGALALAGTYHSSFVGTLNGKNVVCIVSGGNGKVETEYN